MSFVISTIGWCFCLCLMSRCLCTPKAAMIQSRQYKQFPWPSSTFSLSHWFWAVYCDFYCVIILCINLLYDFYCTSKVLMSQLFLLGGGVTSHSHLEDLGRVLAYSNESWFELFQGNRAMALARTSGGGARRYQTLLQRPLEAVGRSSTPTGVVLHTLPLSSSEDRLFTLTARVRSHGRWYKAAGSRCTLRIPEAIDSWSFLRPTLLRLCMLPRKSQR